jgi:hypothetical protein
VDGLLRTFFRSEVPLRWPTVTLAEFEGRGSIPSRSRRGVRWPSRLALAAAVAFFVVSYMSLASHFAMETKDSGAALDLQRTIGVREMDRLRKRTSPGSTNSLSQTSRSGQAVEPTRNGGEALLQWEQLPGSLFMRIEEKRPPRR